MTQAFFAIDLYKASKRDDGDHPPFIYLPDFDVCGEVDHPLLSALHGLAGHSGDADDPAIVNVDLYTRFFNNRADLLPSRSDEGADLARLDFEHFDARRKGGELF